jgi:hypothetical protein
MSDASTPAIDPPCDPPSSVEQHDRRRVIDCSIHLVPSASHTKRIERRLDLGDIAREDAVTGCQFPLPRQIR